VRELRALISSPRGFGSSATPGFAAAGRSGIPWGGLLLGAGVLALIALGVGAVMNRRNAAAVSAGGIQPYSPNSPMQQPATGMPASGSPAAGGMGSAILGGLATGAGVGAGMVAGEALANRLMGVHHSAGDVLPLGGGVPQSDMGGTDFGVADSSSWDDGFGGIGGDGGGDWN